MSNFVKVVDEFMANSIDLNDREEITDAATKQFNNLQTSLQEVYEAGWNITSGDDNLPKIMRGCDLVWSIRTAVDERYKLSEIVDIVNSQAVSEYMIFCLDTYLGCLIQSGKIALLMKEGDKDAKGKSKTQS